ncbi:MAG: hypothetical protein OXU31_01530 [Gammaproteobacteria bacterium]|nr:hypothetical protein [Gammaproteobacteria bacterium]
MPESTKSVPWRKWIPGLPLVVWLLLLSVAIGIGLNDAPRELIARFNAGWGLAAGEFALILLPSFTLAAALERMRIHGSAARMRGVRGARCCCSSARPARSARFWPRRCRCRTFSPRAAALPDC